MKNALYNQNYDRIGTGCAGPVRTRSEYETKPAVWQEWGYDGIVITDWGGSNDHVRGVKCRSDLEMPAPGLDSARQILQALEDGEYMKHFAFNEIEVNRINKECVWLDGQTARELYLRPFEMAVKSKYATGMMASYMWVNGQWETDPCNRSQSVRNRKSE